MSELANKKCVPCEGAAEPLDLAQVEEYAAQVSEWVPDEEAVHIKKSFKFKNFADALDFVNKIGKIAEKQNHHPDIEFGWGYCNVELSTHSIGGLHENDFIIAAKIDEVLK